MPVEVRKLTNANVYFDGQSYLGRVEEVNLPEVAIKQAEHKALGMFGGMDIPAGMDKMELSMKWSTVDPVAMRKVSNAFRSWDFQVRSSMERYEAQGRTAQDSYVAYFRGMPKNIAGQNFKQHDNVEAESKFSITYYKLEINGAIIYEVDVLNNIYKVDGVDLLATYRANLGI
jgi:P2 family phage contractile tail tube protein